MSKITSKARKKKKNKDISFSVSPNLYTVNRVPINRKNQYVKSRYLTNEEKKKKNHMTLLDDYKYVESIDRAKLVKEENEYNWNFLKNVRFYVKELEKKKKITNSKREVKGKRNNLLREGKYKIKLYDINKEKKNLRNTKPKNHKKNIFERKNNIDIYKNKSLDLKKRKNLIKKDTKKSKSVSFNMKTNPPKTTALNETSKKVKKNSKEKSKNKKTPLEKIEETESEDLGTKNERDFEDLKDLDIKIEDDFDLKEEQKTTEFGQESEEEDLKEEYNDEEKNDKINFKERKFKKYNVDGKIDHKFEKNYNDIFDQKKEVYLNAMKGNEKNRREKKLKIGKKAQDFFPGVKNPNKKVVKKKEKIAENIFKDNKKNSKSDISLKLPNDPEENYTSREKELKTPSFSKKESKEEKNKESDLHLPDVLETQNNEENDLELPETKTNFHKQPSELELPENLNSNPSLFGDFEDKNSNPEPKIEIGRESEELDNVFETSNMKDFNDENENLGKDDKDFDEFWEGDKRIDVKESNDTQLKNLNNIIDNAYQKNKEEEEENREFDFDVTNEDNGILDAKPEIDEDAGPLVIDNDPDFEINDDDLEF